MSFYSISFLIFMVAVFLFYRILPHPYRWVALLAANALFYASFEARFLLLLLLLMAGSYFGALLIEKHREKAKQILIALVAVLVLCLAFFKYANFTLTSIEKILGLFAIPFTAPALKILQPVGISFFTFQMIGYLTDVYRGKITACRHFGKYAVFASFFATITSGPIERAGHFLPQLEEDTPFDYERTVSYASILLIGLVKKVVIADTIAKYVDSAYNNLHACSSASILLATLLFAMQIYCDFSGYSDMAVGIGGLLGFDLIRNFKQPYFACSVREFWASWHISLSTWLRDYVYIPLGGNRKGTLRRNLNLILTFLVSGLWHGANWTYVVWGLIHGVAQVGENTVVKRKESKELSGAVRFFRWLVTFLIVCLAWIFFRANSISDAFYALTHLVTAGEIKNTFLNLGMSAVSVVKVLVMAAGLTVYDLFSRKQDLIPLFRKQHVIFRWAVYVIFAVLVIVLKIHNGTDASFIYFKF